MVPIEVMIGEVGVVEISHMQCGQDAVEPAGLVHNLVGHCELHRVEVG